MKHSDYITHIDNKEDYVYLKSIHFPVNMRLFHTSSEYKKIILQQCEYIRNLCLNEKEGYKKPHGMSSANAGLAFNIIGITKNRNKKEEYCQIMINPVITFSSNSLVKTNTNCGSLTLKEPITVERSDYITVEWYDEEGDLLKESFKKETGAFTIQHEVDHNLGILITDYLNLS